jgi:hypothetical protein
MNKWIKTQILILGVCLGSQAIANESMIVNQDFASLFNTYRMAQPKQVPWAGAYFSYGNLGTAIDVIDGVGYKSDGTRSPIYIYDKLFNGGQTPAFNFERDHHSCLNVGAAEKEGCMGWWGHCNGWAAAAIKEVEPRETKMFQGQKLEVGHIKGVLTELWLTANDSFIGDTKKGRASGPWIYDLNDPDYETYWDVTPRQMFLSFTNQIGAMGNGLVIDRFTGDQVWNQPVVGYRILPIRQQDMGQQTIRGQNYYYAKFRMKLYWANDNVHVGHKSKGFNINRTTDSESDDAIADDLDQRLVRFKLFFDAPLQTDGSGTQILGAGNMIGEGYWDLQERPGTVTDIADHSHPDFVWYPQSAYVDTRGSYGNPYINAQNIQAMAGASSAVPVNPPAPPAPPTPPPPPVTPPAPPVTPPVDNSVRQEHIVVVERENVYAAGDDTLIAERLLARVFRRSGLNVDVNGGNITFQGTTIRFKVTFGSDVTLDTLRKSLQDADAKVISIE